MTTFVVTCLAFTVILLLLYLSNQLEEIMSLEREVLDAITSLTSSVDSVILWIQSQPTDVIDAAGKERIIAALNADKDKLDAAIPPPAPPP
jgi:hypothetical protein